MPDRHVHGVTGWQLISPSAPVWAFCLDVLHPPDSPVIQFLSGTRIGLPEDRMPLAEDWRRGVFGGEQVWALDERCGYP
jgi:hypothetical protein